MAHATAWFHSSEVKHLLSHRKPANTAPAKGQTAGCTRCALQGEQRLSNVLCYERGKEKNLQEPQADETLTHVFLCMFLYVSYSKIKIGCSISGALEVASHVCETIACVVLEWAAWEPQLCPAQGHQGKTRLGLTKWMGWIWFGFWPRWLHISVSDLPLLE